jgi:hypothetical protein
MLRFSSSISDSSASQTVSGIPAKNCGHQPYHESIIASTSDVPVNEIATVELRVQDSMARQRFRYDHAGRFRWLCDDSHGDWRFGASRFGHARHAEIAIRMALGARRAGILS